MTISMEERAERAGQKQKLEVLKRIQFLEQEVERLNKLWDEAEQVPDGLSSGKFISPCEPPTGYQAELIEILAEEAAEGIQRVTKALRFGLEEIQPGQDLDNKYRLGLEAGDFLHVLRLCLMHGLIPAKAIKEGERRKKVNLEKFMQNPVPELTEDQSKNWRLDDLSAIKD